MASWLDQAAQGCVQVSSGVSRGEDPTGTLRAAPTCHAALQLSGREKGCPKDEVSEAQGRRVPRGQGNGKAPRAKSACKGRGAFWCWFANRRAAPKGETFQGNWWV